MFGKIIVRTVVVWWITLKYGVRWLFVKARRAELMREAFEELGPTYIKLGQIIASSPGLFPQNYVSEFQKCLDRVPEFPYEDVKRIVGDELDRPIDKAYAFIDEKPIAAASIAQVHAARLHDGTDVVIKVQRPSIRKQVEADLWFMHKGAWLAEKLSLEARLANAQGVIEDFEKTIYEELDFTVEGKNMDEFNSIMKTHDLFDQICAPEVHWDFTTRRLLTMERFYGFKADDVKTAQEKGMDSEKWLRIGLRGWNLTMMLHGFFHGDVHAGNLMFLPEKQKIGFIDFGIVGRFDKKQRMQVMRYILSFTTQDFRELAAVMAEMGAFLDDKEPDLDELAGDMRRVYTPLLEQNMAEIDYGRALPDIIANSRTHGIRMPREFILILKQLLYFDRYAKLAAPNLNVFNDLYLVDFLFTPAAAKAGIDLSEIGKLLQAVQKARMQQDAAAKKAAAAKEAVAAGQPAEAPAEVI